MTLLTNSQTCGGASLATPLAQRDRKPGTFLISYPVGWQYGATFAEVDGEATVSPSGEVEIKLEDVSGNSVTLTGMDLEMATVWLRAERAPQIREAAEDAWLGEVAHHREIARTA